jgi:hypothetical protein
MPGSFLPFDLHHLKHSTDHPSFNEAFDLRSSCQRWPNSFAASDATPLRDLVVS